MKRHTHFHHLPLVLIILLLLLSIPVSAADTTGTLESGQTWNFDVATGTLSVSGTGDLPDYPYSSSLESQAPWKAWADSIKSIILSEGITDTGDCTFHQLKNLTKIKLPSTLKIIGNNAFSDAKKLKEVAIPQGVTAIGQSAFKGCTALPDVSLPEGLLTIGNRAFNGCNSLIAVTIPASVIVIDNYAFGDCPMLQYVAIKSAPKIGEECFDATVLQLICFSGDVPEFSGNSLRDVTAECYYPKNNATWNTASLENFSSTCTWTPHADPGSITFSENSGQCGENATWSYENGTLTISGSSNVTKVLWAHHEKNIQKVIIENGITNVPGWAFQGYTKLKTVKLADSITIIENSAFQECTALTSITLPKNLVTIEQSAFLKCTSLKEIKMGNKVATLGTFAFSGTAIAEITLSDSLTTMGDSVFNGCKQLKELRLPATLKEMGDYIITGCSALKTVYFYGNLPETTGMNYNGTNAVVYYPKDNKTWASENLPFMSGGFILRPYTVCSTDGHTYGGWINIEEPTAEKEGRKQRVCNVCKHIEYGTVPKLTGDTSEAPPSAPATGPSIPPATEPSTPPATEPSVPATAPASQATVPSSAVSDNPSGSEVPANEPNPIIYIIIACLAIALIGCAVWFFLLKRK